MANLVTAYDTRTGKKRLVPENWFDHESLSRGLSRSAPEGVEEEPAALDSDQEQGQGDLTQVTEPAQTPATKAGRGKSRTTTETPAAGETQE